MGNFCPVIIIFCLSIFYVCLQTVSPEDVVTQVCSTSDAQTSCGSCIRAHPDCTWCKDNTTSIGSQQVRCRSLAENQLKCNSIEKPQSSSDPTDDRPFSSGDILNNDTVIQLKPQAISLKLRTGQAQKVNITFRKVVDYPLDLYYVMDLSNSMKDDLDKLKALGSSLVTGIKNITQNVQLGFGSFVDKVMMPYASTVPDQLLDPCSKTGNTSCAPVFGFRHQLAITSEDNKFIEAVNSTSISGNIDSPEGGFDALMQIAVCQDFIKWRTKALHVILFTSDASPHIAMDGKLAAILQANDMKCHLSKGILPYESDAIYTKSKFMDYPSIGQLREAFDKFKIQIIFAVTESVQGLYKDMPSLLDNSFVDQLEGDSSNIISVIRKSYNALKSKIQLSSPTKPSNIDMSYRVLCPGDSTWRENSLECTNINIGSEVIFQFEFLSTSCPQEPSKEDMVLVTSNSLQDQVEISIEYICDCNCTASPVVNSTLCSSYGNLQCGICSCHGGRLGKQCQCSPSTSQIPLEANCSKSGIPSDSTPLCNGNGFCECGKCQCNDGYFGEFCQCRSLGCRMFDNKLCGGIEKGDCNNCDENQKCDCKNGWYLNPNGVCTCNNMTCQKNGITCSGNGVCDCDHCDCTNKNLYSGVFCEKCIHPLCRTLDVTCGGEEVKKCAECVNNAQRFVQDTRKACNASCHVRNLKYKLGVLPSCNYGCDDEDCNNCLSEERNISYSSVCVHTLDSGCKYSYRVEWVQTSLDYFIFVKDIDKENDCPQPVNALLIVLPVVGGIVLIGLIALIVWKLYQTLHDKQEYESFMEESKQKKWIQSVNPIFSKASVRIENPAYIGGKM